jgi:hypothetical protein
LGRSGLDGLFSFVQGRGEVEEIEFGKIANFADECGQGQFEFSEGGVLFWASGGGYQGAQLSHALFQGGGHNALRVSEIGEFGCTVFPVRSRGDALGVSRCNLSVGGRLRGRFSVARSGPILIGQQAIEFKEEGLEFFRVTLGGDLSC